MGTFLLFDFMVSGVWLSVCFVLIISEVHYSECIESTPKEKDFIHFLPGSKIGSKIKQYSGYLHGSTDNIRLHYWLVECQQHPESAPLILWLNGGPGCSSMEGLLTENGPYTLTDTMELDVNHFSWNTLGNLLYIEAPAGVGFSYTVDGNWTTDDDLTSLNNFHAMVNFMEKFPEYKGRDLYVTGESYGGVYVPTLVLRLLNSSSFNVKGMAVGNGLTSYLNNDNSLLYFINYHGMIDENTWNDLLNNCCDFNVSTRCLFTKSTSNHCQKLVNLVSTDMINGLSRYNIYLPCVGGVKNEKLSMQYLSHVLTSTRPYVHHDFGNLFRTNKYHAYRRHLLSLLRQKPNTKLTIPCEDDTVITTYLNTEAVREALHVELHGINSWQVCNEAINLNYIRTYQDLTEQYKQILQSHVPILIYNGDVDMACNYLGDEWFVDDLQLELTTPYERWLYKAYDGTSQIGGFWRRAELDGTPLLFTTVRGAGHMVPRDKPIPTLHMMRSFMSSHSL